MEAKDEILRIQRMVAGGRVTPEDSVELIEALGRAAEPKPAPGGARRITKERAAAFSFYALLAAAGCAVMSQVLDSADTLYRPNQIASTFAALFAGAALICGLVSFVLGRLALAGRPLPGEKLSGWPRIQASISPLIVAAWLLVLNIAVLPAACLFVLERPIAALLSGGDVPHLGRLQSYLTMSESGFIVLMVALWTLCAAGTFTVISGVSALLVRKWCGGVRAVFAPLLNRLKREHWKRLLIASGVSAAVAAASLVIFLVLRGQGSGKPVRRTGTDEPGTVEVRAE
ncbi:MAG: hypothetical protein ACYS9X_19975 [Planctomycetota bacterium]|jgi:hypothetical protein